MAEKSGPARVRPSGASRGDAKQGRPSSSRGGTFQGRGGSSRGGAHQGRGGSSRGAPPGRPSSSRGRDGKPMKRNADSTRAKDDAMRKKLKVTAEEKRDARHELVVKCNKLWNDLRSKEIDDAKRQGMCTELYKLLKGKVLSFAQRPDTSRVIQSIFKFGDSMLRKAVLDELTSELVVLSKGKHSSFLVVTLLRYGDAADRIKIAGQLRENVRALSTHANGARVLNYCLFGSPVEGHDEDVITKNEKKRFYERFYGPDVILLSGKAQSSTAEASDDNSLAQYLPAETSKRSSALSYLKKLVLKMAEKGLLRFPYAQFLCYQVVANVSREEAVEMIPSVSEAALAMVGTWEGTLAVVRCLLAGDAKDRKKMIKEWKDHIVDLCAHRYGWYLVARAVDSVDDTKMLGQSIVDEITEDKEKLSALLQQEDGYGRKVFLRVLAAPSRVAHYFEKFEETFLKDPEGISTSKKDPMVRNNEVFAKMRDPLLEVIGENASAMLKNARATDVIRELMHHTLTTKEDQSCEARLKTIKQLAASSMDSLDDAKGHATLKRMIKDETEWLANSDIKIDSEHSFAVALTEEISGKMAELAKTNRSAFVLEALATHPLTQARVKKEIGSAKSKLPKDVKGTEALLKALK